ncbi:MAG: amidase family protein, partial [Thermohalobaculum sp.]|nr:amidase family protein [Thermohalobaculum sp.]
PAARPRHARPQREPLAQPAPEVSFRRAAETPSVPRRVAFTPDLGGLTPVDPEVAAICEAAARRYQALGAEVVAASPDFTGAHEAFQTLRAVAFATGHAAHYAEKRALLKPDVVWNIEKGQAITGAEVAQAQIIRTRITAALVEFFRDFDLLLCPATCVAPFPVGERTVTECAGVTFPTYIDWLAIAYAITLTSAPALSLPCGFTASGLPVGLQVVAPLRSEARLLSLAASLERELGVETGPIDPRAGT